MNDSAPYEHPWQRHRLIIGLGLAIAAIAVNLAPWADIARIVMRDEEASQIYLVPIIVGWLVWARRASLHTTPIHYSLVGPAVMALGWALMTFGFFNAIQAFWHGGAVCILMGAVLTTTGLRMLRHYWPALIVLMFLVPVPGMIRLKISIPMQEATAAVTAFVTLLLGMDVQRAGSVLIYNGQDIGVAEACNGMRMVFSLLLVTFAYTFATPLRSWVRLLLIVLSPLSAIVCNVIRLVPTIWAYGHYDPEIATLFHDYSGWVMIVIALLLLMGLVALMRWAQLPVDPVPRDLPQRRDGA